MLERLPLNYDGTTLWTIEQIDVLWMKGRSIRRAFEVEHTTSVYSGILRMADLLALQPNMDIRLRIVAPDARREKVFQEPRRPLFSLLDRGPLSESCTYVAYDSIRELSKLPHLAHLSASVLETYAEAAEDWARAAAAPCCSAQFMQRRASLLASSGRGGTFAEPHGVPPRRRGEFVATPP